MKKSFKEKVMDLLKINTESDEIVEVENETKEIVETEVENETEEIVENENETEEIINEIEKEKIVNEAEKEAIEIQENENTEIQDIKDLMVQMATLNGDLVKDLQSQISKLKNEIEELGNTAIGNAVQHSAELKNDEKELSEWEKRAKRFDDNLEDLSKLDFENE